MKWIYILLLCFGAWFAFFLVSHDRSHRFADVIRLKNALKVAHADYKKTGTITNYPTSPVRVSLSTNLIVIDSTNYQIFAEASIPSRRPNSTIAVTTNDIYLLIQPNAPPRVISSGYRPPYFSKWL